MQSTDRKIGGFLHRHLHRRLCNCLCGEPSGALVFSNRGCTALNVAKFKRLRRRPSLDF